MRRFSLLVPLVLVLVASTLPMPMRAAIASAQSIVAPQDSEFASAPLAQRHAPKSGQTTPLRGAMLVPTTTFTGTATASILEFVTSFESEAADFLHTATQLGDGSVLIDSGAYDGFNNNQVSQRYDPVTRSVEEVGPIETYAYGSATLLDDGAVLFAGGVYAQVSLRNASLFDPVSNEQTAIDNLTYDRYFHTATLLADGRVLIVGGASTYNDYRALHSAELYDPVTKTFTVTGSLNNARSHHTATLLPDGRVLIVGGGDYFSMNTPSEIYNPATGTFTNTLDSYAPYSGNAVQATRLNDGRILVTSGANGKIFDPETDTWLPTRDVAYAEEHLATLLANGKVLLLLNDGRGEGLRAYTFDPATNSYSSIGTFNQQCTGHTATLLPDGDILIGCNQQLYVERLVDTNTFTGTMTLPDGWATTATPTITVSGTTSDTPLNAGSVNNGPWFDMQPGVAVTTTLPAIADGRDQPVRLRLRDTDGHVSTVVLGNIDVDRSPPRSAIAKLPAYSQATFTVSWTGNDSVSDIVGYDLDVRDTDDDVWTHVLTNTQALSTTFTGVQGHTYGFRVRAINGAGLIEAWSDTPDTTTTVDTVAPAGSLTINRGALATTVPTVTLQLSATDSQSSVKDMRIAQSVWSGTGGWLPFAAATSFVLAGSDDEKTIYAQYRDSAGNVSDVVTGTIQLDTAAGNSAVLSINNGAAYTNSVTVTLRVGAVGQTWQMQLSNDGGFDGAEWQPFDARPTWQLEPFDDYIVPRIVYVRTRGIDGTIHQSASDNIIYDPLPPSGSVAVSAVNASSLTVRLQASDQAGLSGVGDMRVSTNAQFTGASWQPFTTSAVVPRDSSATTVYAQFRDRAGNLSVVRAATPRGPADVQVFLPLVRR